MIGAAVFCFNEQENIESTVQALIRVQVDHPELAEICLVDDCSTDETYARMTDLAEMHPCITVIRHESNLGASHAVASAAAATTCGNVLIVPGDYTYESGAIAAMIDEFTRAQSRNCLVLGLRSRTRVKRSWLREQAAVLARASLLWTNVRRGVLPDYGFILTPTWVIRAVPHEVRGYGQAIGLLGVAMQCRLNYVTTPVEQVPDSHSRGSSITADKIMDVLVAHRALWVHRKETRAIGRRESLVGTSRFD